LASSQIRVLFAGLDAWIHALTGRSLPSLLHLLLPLRPA
jgi:hypothetical protein